MLQEFKISSERKLIGKKMTMTFSDNRTGELWRSFMPHRKEILNALDHNLYSLQLYDSSMDFKEFDLNKLFEKLAAVVVSDFINVPAGMESFTLPAGLYAVFHYKGAASSGADAFRYFFGQWLPASGYVPDNRPHFEILGEKYKNDDPDSEEEIWIPVTPAL